jgi:hypothetical protein
MKHSKLRIAWSVAWGIAAVLLVALWVRSYWWWDTIGTKSNNSLATSLQGWVYIDRFVNADISSTTSLQIHDLLGARLYVLCIYLNPGPTVWNRASTSGSWSLTFPIWSATIAAATLAYSPWVRWSKQFSLRTLLIATTLVAVGLGLIVWLAR